VKLEVLKKIPEAKSNKAPLLFVHGGLHGAWCWQDKFLPYFSSNGFPSYALSLRGHGNSDGGDRLDSFSFSDYLEDILKVILSLKEKPILIGHSMGGAITQKVLHFHPAQIKAVVLMASIGG
jgi:pimeloyl-ACP methyl ester carboxylesterase